MTASVPIVDTLDLLPDPAVRLDADRYIAEVNAAGARFFGRLVDDIIGRPIADIACPRTLTGEPLLAHNWHRSAALRSVTAIPEHEAIVATPAGDVPVRVTGRYTRDRDGHLTGAVLAFRPARRRVNEATGAEVVATVSHELRSPLTSVKGFTSLLLNRWDRIPDPEKRTMLEQIHHDADRVTRLIGELLDISRLETGRLQLRRQLVDLPVLTARVIEKLRVTYADLECKVTYADGFPRVYADPDKVEQVLTNLIENAAKYADGGAIRVVGEHGDGTVTISVHDRGDGIPASDLPNLFRKFFRRDHGKPSGTGLGLWISRGLVEAHGGRLTAESRVGEGSTFCFTLPLVTFDDE